LRQAALPAAAALGGMLVPAAVYLPVATDIAFAVGILALLGRRVPASLRVLLLTLAVIDDLGAIIVIALFYSSGVALQGLLFAVAGFRAVFMLQRFGVRAKTAYLLPAFVAWAGTYAAGIHPTIAGVILRLMTPVRAWLGREGLLIGVRRELGTLVEAGAKALPSRKLAGTLHRIEVARREALWPTPGSLAARPDLAHPGGAQGGKGDRGRSGKPSVAPVSDGLRSPPGTGRAPCRLFPGKARNSPAQPMDLIAPGGNGSLLVAEICHRFKRPPGRRPGRLAALSGERPSQACPVLLALTAAFLRRIPFDLQTVVHHREPGFP
jgi:hypothetical protein